MKPEILCCKFRTQALISFHISISNVGTFKFEDKCLIPQLKLLMLGITINHATPRDIEKKLNCKRCRSMFDPEIHRTKVLILNQNMHFVKVNILHAKRLS